MRRKARPDSEDNSESSMAMYLSPVRSLGTFKPAMDFQLRTACASKYRRDLGFQRLGIERLHDVVADAGSLGRNHVLGLRLGCDHDERRRLQRAIRAHQ